MLAFTAAAIAIVACSCILGQGLRAVAGEVTWAWWAPGAGFGALLALSGICIRLPGHAETAAAVIAVTTVAALVPRSVRRALATALPDVLLIGGLALLAWLIPFLVWRRIGILGEGINNDSGAHLATAWWLEHRSGPIPVSAPAFTPHGLKVGQVPLVGYPDGPHGLIAALAVGHIGLEHAFAAMVVAPTPLMALVALGALPPAARGRRLVAALLVGLCYLAASFTAQSGFKETIEELLILTAAVGARDLVRGRDGPIGWRAALPLGVAIAAPVYSFSYTGPVWTLATAGAVALTSGRVRAALAAAPGALLAAIVVAAPAIGQMIRFADSPFSNENGTGNLGHAISPLELFGAWLNFDFRWTPDPLWPTLVGTAVVAAAAVVALARLIRRHELALPAALLPVLAIYAYTVATKSFYLSAKAGAMASPLVALTIGAGLLLPGRRAVAVLGTLAAAFAATASFLVLRDAHVAPVEHRHELASLRPHMGRGAILVMTKDDLNQWNLVGLRVFQPRDFYAPLQAPVTPARPRETAGFFDFDNFSARTLNRFRYAITTNTPYQSAAPSNWKPVVRTRSFILWRRSGRTPTRYATDFASTPGRVLDCNSSFGRLRLAGARGGRALVLPRPIVGRSVQWHGQPWEIGEKGSMTLRVPRGTWDVSLAYASMSGLTLMAPGLRAPLPPSMDRVGPFYLAGTLTQRRNGPVSFVVSADELGIFGRLLGTRGRTRALDSPSNVPLGGLALTRHGQKGKLVPATAACGRYVDHVLPGS